MASSKTGAPRRLRNIQIRLNPVEAARVEGDLDDLRQTSLVAVKPGSYAKAALLAYPHYRRMEAGLRDLARSIRGRKIAAHIHSLLAGESQA